MRYLMAEAISYISFIPSNAGYIVDVKKMVTN